MDKKYIAIALIVGFAPLFRTLRVKILLQLSSPTLT